MIVYLDTDFIHADTLGPRRPLKLHCFVKNMTNVNNVSRIPLYCQLFYLLMS